MEKEIVVRLSKSFEGTVHIEQEVEYWTARDLQVLFEYSSWDNFLNVIEKAKIACSNSKLLIHSRFREVMKMVNLGSGTKREISDIMLSDRSKWRFPQARYFLCTKLFCFANKKARKHIVMVERLEARPKLTQTEKELSTALYQHGVDNQLSGGSITLLITSAPDSSLDLNWSHNTQFLVRKLAYLGNLKKRFYYEHYF